MENIIKKYIKKLFEVELNDLKGELNNNITTAFDKLQDQVYGVEAQTNKRIDSLTSVVSDVTSAAVDVHEMSKSWAVLSIAGKKGKPSYVKFIDLGETDIKLIADFLKQFERKNIDASPMATEFLNKTFKY